MVDPKKFELTVSNLKCFESFQGFSGIYPINLIVGRNNAGKSALLDFLQAHITRAFNPALDRKGNKPIIRTGFDIDQHMTLHLIRENAPDYHRHNPASALKAFGKVRHSSTWNSDARQHQNELSQTEHSHPFSHREALLRFIRQAFPDPVLGTVCKRLRADRDMGPEDPRTIQKVEENGQGATALIVRFLTYEGYDHAEVELRLRSSLNMILHPDWDFKRIYAKCIDPQSNKWEIKFECSAGPQIALSQSGSGIKTLLLVLVNLLLLPKADNFELSACMFCLEELENNLHPAVQRRLFKYLRDFAKREKTRFFLTTHSSAVIDFINNDDDAQIVHVTHNSDRAIVNQVSSFVHRKSLLDDLDVRASDLLQANVVVWLEGPSDRIFFNKWIELFSDGLIQEHAHYECVLYGGSVLANFSIEPDVPDNALIDGLKVNRNAIIVMDSDRRKGTDNLKPRVQRVCEEAVSSGSYAWVTAGREVENYIPWEVLKQWVERVPVRPPGKCRDVFELLPPSYRKKKPALAHKVREHLTKDSIISTLDLGQRLQDVCERIQKWNGMPISQ